ncbi:hypothetical protein NQ318_002254 [Aromia moschata]|uniref:CRAL-TRIO domain-containing protein n=1 Tax=Aromia moschata TaxID=1265417 RepID=A0AAV8Z471_9CUCU|nr:hypothetical protein NQ318_002254 [Aromia moschata]
MYYTIRTLLPELYENKHPLLPHMQWIANNVYIAPSPKLTEEGYRVTCIKLIDNNPQKFEPYDFFAHCFNILEVVLEEDLILAGIVVYDFKHMTTEHMLKITPICLKKVLLITEKVYRNKVKGIHYVNAPPFINRLVSIVKQLLKPKMAARLFVHDSMDKLFDYIPKEVLPEDYGGDEMSLRKLNELWKQKLIEYKDRFDALEKMKVKEELRPTPLVNDEVLGFHGNFKKLAVD